MTEVLWISHRGLREKHAENTAEAFQAAVNVGFKGLETDLRATVDGHIVLCHDVDLRRVLGRDDVVHSLTRAQLASLRFPGGESFLFLDQFIQQFSQCQWVFDIKPEQVDKTFNAFKNLVLSLDAHALFRRTKFLFWDRSTQEIWQRHWPEIRCYGREAECYRAALCTRFGFKRLAGIRPGMTYALVDVWHGVRLMLPSLVEAYHQAGAQVCAYLPDTEQEARAALVAGVDEIITNHHIVLGKD